ncbi:Hsp20/alpha crystallin family protein [Candidatus Hydrogenedentota bacterium]
MQDFEKIFGEIETIVDGLSDRRSVLRHAGSNLWRPPMDIYELPEKFLITLELAGMREDQFEVSLVGNRIDITGTRDDLSPKGKVRIHQLEINFGRFLRRLSIPENIDRSRIRAFYKDGFLRVELPKTQ